MAFLYHAIEKCGTDGGFIENLPETLRCGSFRCGSDQEKLNLDLMVSITLDTVFFAAVILSEIAVLMLSKILVTVFFAAVSLSVKYPLIASSPFEIVVFAYSILFEIMLLMPSYCLPAMRDCLLWDWKAKVVVYLCSFLRL